MRANELFPRIAGHLFRTRSIERDSEQDLLLVTRVAAALDDAIKTTEEERAGLKRRIDDVLARAAIVAGNEVDEYLTRDDERSQAILSFESEIKRGEARAEILTTNLAHLKFVRAALQSRFPDCP